MATNWTDPIDRLTAAEREFFTVLASKPLPPQSPPYYGPKDDVLTQLRGWAMVHPADRARIMRQAKKEGAL